MNAEISFPLSNGQSFRMKAEDKPLVKGKPVLAAKVAIVSNQPPGFSQEPLNRQDLSKIISALQIAVR